MEDKIYKINLKKYEIWEYIYVVKEYKTSLKVLVMDFGRDIYYIEENYPLEFLQDKHTLQIPKIKLYYAYKNKMEKFIRENYEFLYFKLTNFKEQKKLF